MRTKQTQTSSMSLPQAWEGDSCNPHSLRWKVSDVDIADRWEARHVTHEVYQETDEVIWLRSKTHDGSRWLISNWESLITQSPACTLWLDLAWHPHGDERETKGECSARAQTVWPKCSPALIEKGERHHRGGPGSHLFRHTSPQHSGCFKASVHHALYPFWSELLCGIALYPPLKSGVKPINLAYMPSDWVTRRYASCFFWVRVYQPIRAHPAEFLQSFLF